MDYTIAENYTLPSLGKIYKVEVNPKIKIRSMTTQDEMKRLSTSSEGAYKNICDIIDDCLVEKPGISSYDMHLGDYQFLLHKMRIVTYGADYNLQSSCPYCASINSDIINLDDIRVFEYNESIQKYFEFDLPKSKRHIKLRMQTPRILDEIQERSKELKRKSPNFVGDPAFLISIEKMIDEVDGKKPNPLNLTDFVKNLPMMDTNYIIQHCQKINESIGLDVLLHNTCNVCGLDYETRFRANSEFFGPIIDI